MLFSSTAANGFSKDHGLEQNYYYHHTRKVVFVIWHFVVAVDCILITVHRQSLPPSTYLMCHNDDVR